MELQNQQTPSAQDHTRQPTRPAPLGGGRSASHHAEQDARGEMSQSPDRLNVDDHGVDIYDEPEEMTAETGTNDGQNGQYNNGMGTEEGELTDGEGDDILDDDLMDKISSSPSIDDGGYPSPVAQSVRQNSLTPKSSHTRLLSEPLVLDEDTKSSFSFPSPPNFSFLFLPEHRSQLRAHRHERGCHTSYDTEGTVEQKQQGNARSQTTPSGPGSKGMSRFAEDFGEDTGSSSDNDLDSIRLFLLPVDDPLLDNSFVDVEDTPSPLKSICKLREESHVPFCGPSPSNTLNNEDDFEPSPSFSDDLPFLTQAGEISAYEKQRISTLSLCMHCIPSSLPLRDKQTQRREIQWFSLTIVTVTGGLSEL